jgi:transposase
MKEYKLISIDLAKSVFQICAFSKFNKIAFNQKVRRNKVLDRLRNIEPTTVVMEACYSSNYWGREIQKLGHTVKLIPPFVVKPFLIGNKNDANDAVAIGEASFRPKARFVSVKTIAQQDMQTLLRVREQLQKVRIMTSNQIHGFLSEYGVFCAKGHKSLMITLAEALAPESNLLSPIAIEAIQMQSDYYRELKSKEDEITKRLVMLCKYSPLYHYLLSIPGVGPIVAATLISSVGDPCHFKHSRQFSAWIGLTPLQHASGETSRMGKISKRGDRRLRQMLIHGARSIVNWVKHKDDKLSLWIKSLQKRMTPNKVNVAVANKLARIAWAVMTYQVEYHAK